MNDRGIETSSYKGKLGPKRFEQLKHANHWHRTGIQRIVTNKVYTGVLIQNQWTQTRKERKKVLKPESEWIINECPSIIDTSLYERAQLQLEKNRTYSQRSTKKEHTYMLSSLLEDKDSGYSYVGYTSSKGTKNYRINTRNKVKGYVAPRGISAGKIEPVIWDKIISVLQDPQLLLSELKKLETKNNARDIEGEISLLNRKNTRTREQSQRLLSLLSESDGMPIEDIKAMIREKSEDIEKISHEIEKLKKLRLSEEQKQEQLKNLENLSQRILPILRGKLSEKGKMEICRLLIDKIYVKDSNLEIHLFVPEGEKSTTSQQASTRLNLVRKFFNDENDFLTKKELPSENSLESSMLCNVIGGSSEARTQDLLLKRELLYQLS